MQIIKIKVGDEIKLEFIASKIKGKKPVAKADNGKICLIHKDCKEHILPGAIWISKVLQINEKTIIVKPIIQFANVYQAAQNKENAIKLLEEKYANSSGSVKKKIIRNFPYKSTNK